MLVAANGIRINVIEVGSGHPVVFLHGLGCDGSDWDPQIEHFSSGYRCVAVDHRGHGRSDRTYGAYSLGLFARDLRDALDSLGIEHLHLVGLSMGGMIAQQFAIENPAMVCTLALLDTFCTPGAATEQLEQSAALVETQGLGMLAAGFEAMTFSPLTFERRPDILARFRRIFEANDTQCLARSMRAISGIDIAGRLGSLQIPTVVLWGEHDNLTPRDRADELAAAIRGARLEIVPEAGHFSNLENAEHVNGILAKHFADATCGRS